MKKTLLLLVASITIIMLGACGAPADAPAEDASTQAEGEQGDSEAAGEEAADPGEPVDGGTLTFAVGGEPASFDCHREASFTCIHPIAPFYSTLLTFDQWNYPEVIGDVAEEWTVSDDGLTYTFTIREGITFHDGAALTASDVKATYDKIVFPGEDQVSRRKGSYLVVESIEAPDDQTVVFTLQWPSASFLANLASPWNFIYSAEKLAEDPFWYETNIVGTGPFKFEEYTPGAFLNGVKNEDYFVEGRPYLDGFTATFIRSTGARVAAVRGGEAMIEFRGFTPADRDAMVSSLGDKITVQEGPWLCYLSVALNHEQEPFDDARFRRALTLALDRYEASETLSQIANVKYVGGVMRPGSEYAATEEELLALGGYGDDIEAARAEARELLAEAGIEEGFSFTFKNRDVPMPYEPMGIWLVDQWRQIGLDVELQVVEGGDFISQRAAGDFDAAMDWECGFMDEPDLQLAKYLSIDKSGANYSRYTNETLDDLYEQQSRATSFEERRELIREFEQVLLDEEVHTFPTLWWFKINPHSSRVQGWNQLPSHYLNQTLADVWLIPE